MSYYTRISKSFEGALCLPLRQNSRYVLFSDCHRGTGRANDNFLNNEYLFLAALKYYYPKGFTYLELGDGDELWENRSFEHIKEMHHESFEMMAKYYQKGRLYAIYGNHDMVKKSARFSNKYCHSYYCDNTMCDLPLFPDITYYPGVILQDAHQKKDIYLTHGHQADFLNSTLWRLSRFLVRYIWRPMETLGIPDPTSAAKNNTKKKKSEKLLTFWAKQNNHILITGHTHHPMIGTRNSPYCNTGSCVSAAGLTCIEIENRCITLVKWTLGTKQNQALYVIREPLGETVCIDDYQ